MEKDLVKKLSCSESQTDSFSGTDTGGTTAGNKPRRRHRSTSSKSMSSIHEGEAKKKLISEEGVEEGSVSLWQLCILKCDFP